VKAGKNLGKGFSNILVLRFLREIAGGYNTEHINDQGGPQMESIEGLDAALSSGDSSAIESAYRNALAIYPTSVIRQIIDRY
jgi:hypothetical protein